MSHLLGGFKGSKVDTTTSGWLDGSSANAPMSVVVRGLLTGDKCDVRVSNDVDRPGASEIGVAYADITTNGVTAIALPFRWLMLRRYAKGGTPGAVSASVFAHRPPA